MAEQLAAAERMRAFGQVCALLNPFSESRSAQPVAAYPDGIGVLPSSAYDMKPDGLRFLSPVQLTVGKTSVS